MLKTAGYDIVFREIPDEISLALNISNCPFKCPGCHSPYLQEDVGEELTWELLEALYAKYSGEATCILFMGGDACPEEVKKLAGLVKRNHPGLKTGWYSGRDELLDESILENLDYLKLGRYVEALGGLDSEKTNQKLWKISGGEKTKEIKLRK